MANWFSRISYHATREQAEKHVEETRDYYWGYGPMLKELVQEKDGRWKCNIEMMDSCD